MEVCWGEVPNSSTPIDIEQPCSAENMNKKVTFAPDAHASGTMNLLNNNEKNKAESRLRATKEAARNIGKLSLHDLQKAAKASPLKKKKRKTVAKKRGGASITDDRTKEGPRFRQYQAENWSLRIKEVKLFVGKHGHCIIPHDYPPNQILSRWAKRQRYQYKLYKVSSPRSSMTVERIKSLEDLGFCWDAHKTLWSDRYEDLRQFVKENGHANVPTSYRENRQLATWVKCQRRQYKLWKAGGRANINGDRVKLLESIGFKWAIARS
jgi:hypothetical protein